MPEDGVIDGVTDGAPDGSFPVRTQFVDTPFCEFSAANGDLISGRASGVNPVRGGSDPPSGLLCASSMALSCKSISMISIYSTQSLIMKRRKNTCITLTVSDFAEVPIVS